MKLGQTVASTVKTDLATILLTLAGGRFYPAAAPPKPTTPYGVYLQVIGRPNVTLDADRAGLTRHLFQVDVYDPTYLGADGLHQQLQAAMANANTFKAIQLSQRDLYEPDTKLHRVLTEWSIWAA